LIPGQKWEASVPAGQSASARSSQATTTSGERISDCGLLRLAQHQTVDQAHAAIQERLTPVGASISRREILYLFDAYCTLLRASQDIAADHAWPTTARANGGIILSIDGIQPDKGNETIYLVRDVVTGRLLAAENVRRSDATTITALLRPIHT
jgi:hypothetical protein